MSPLAAYPIKTAYTLVEALKLADIQERALNDAGLDPEDMTESVIREYRDIAFIQRLADGRFNQLVLELEDSHRIERTLQAVPLFAVHAAFGAHGLYLATDRFEAGFSHKVALELRKNQRESSDPFASVGFETFAAVVEEATVYSVITPDEEVRRCAYCSEWFAGKYRGRNRFCSVDCRRKFSILVKNDSKNKFDCALRDHVASVADFAGLTTVNNDELTIAGYKVRTSNTCVACANMQLPGWRAYLAPLIGNLSDRGDEE